MKALQQGQARSRSVGRAVDWSVSRDNHTRRVRLLQYNTAQYEYRTTSTASTTTQYVRVRVRHQIRAGDTRQEQRLDWPTARPPTAGKVPANSADLGLCPSTCPPRCRQALPLHIQTFTVVRGNSCSHQLQQQQSLQTLSLWALIVAPLLSLSNIPRDL